MSTKTARNFYTTAQVASQLGMTRECLYVYINRHPAFKPAEKHGYQYLWTDGDVSEVAVARRRSRPINPKKQIS